MAAPAHVPDSPRITVLMPVYNGARYLASAVASILGQSFDPFEFLVVDDGSTDESAAIVSSFGDPRIRLVRSGANAGIARALDRGLSLARGEYVARMDCDDESLPRRLETQLRFLDLHPSVGAVGTGFVVIDGGGREIRTVRYPPDHASLAWSLFFCNPLAHPTVMMRKADAARAGGYAVGDRFGPERRTPEDYDLWRRMAKTAALANVPDALVRVRQHGANLMMAGREEYLSAASAIQRLMVAERLGGEIPPSVARAILSRECRSPEDAAGAVETILKLRRSFLDDAATPAEAARFIRKDAAGLLLTLFRRNRRHVRPGEAAALLLRSDWRLFPDLLGGLAAKLGARLGGR